MLGGNGNPYPIQLLVNFWEIRPSAMGRHLDRLLAQGVTNLAAFVPWHLVETDISHTLLKFLQALAEKKMSVTLIATPEVGVHYANSGLPKDVLAKPENLAKHPGGGPVVVPLPPKHAALPSYHSPEFLKRYNQFLARLDGMLCDFAKAEGRLLENVTVATTGSFWKYYRSPAQSVGDAFGAGVAGDCSGSVSLAYRQRLEQFYAQKEFTAAGANPSGAARWKTQSLEDVNRRWFHQNAEDVFRVRTSQLLKKKSGVHSVRMEPMELFTPEADPAFYYSAVMQMLSGGSADFARLSKLADEAATRATAIDGAAAAPFIHWTSMGPFRTLSDSEKQFLVLKSLLLMAGRGGGVLIDEAEWFALSHTFRSRAEALCRTLLEGELKLKNHVLYLAPHIWSHGGVLWEDLYRRVGPRARLVGSMDAVLQDRQSKLLVLDPATLFTVENVLKVLSWARGGRVAVLPRSSLYTDAARAELESALSGGEKIEMNWGVPFCLHPVGDGKVILYDLPEGLSIRGEVFAAWQRFLDSVLSVSDVSNICSLSDSRLHVIPLAKQGGGIGLFILNGTRRAVSADILFPGEVLISDLASAMSADQQARSRSSEPIPATRFALEVPPCGILPLEIQWARTATQPLRTELPNETQSREDVHGTGL